MKDVNRSSNHNICYQDHQKRLTKDQIFGSYLPIEVEGYCKQCDHYGKRWSCPPHPFSADQLLAPYDQAILIARRVITDIPRTDQNMMEVFLQERMTFANWLMDQEKTIQEKTLLLIAGNCYHCKTCQREQGKECIFPEKMHYSLESIGFLVSDLIEKYLELSLSWTKEGDPIELTMVAMIWIEAI